MEKLRSKIFACFLALSLVLLTTPIGLSFDTESKSIEIQSNKAHAVVPVAGAAAALLAEMAAAAGLTVSEFVTTVVGMAAVGTGIGLATDAGINYGNSAAVNLGNLMDAADYPSWDSLSDDSKEAWGSKEYYDSAKFNSLLDAFDLGDARSRFYSSGGGFEFTSDETNRLEQLGRIGQNWINNGSNTVQSILDSMSPNYNQYIGSYIGHSTYKRIDGSTVPGWPSNAPETVYLNVGNAFLYKAGPQQYNGKQTYQYVKTESTGDVYWLVCRDSSNNFGYIIFSKSGFKSGERNKYIPADEEVVIPQVTPTANPVELRYNGETYYRTYSTRSSFSGGYECTMQLTDTTGYDLSSFVNDVVIAILFNDSLTSGLGQTEPNIIGYPDSIQEQGDTNIYMPSIGVVPDTNWDDYETPTEQPPIIDEEVDLTEIIELLKRFHFTVDYNLLVQDNPLRSAVMEMVSALNRFSFYNVTGQLKVHDEGVYEGLGDIGGILRQIQATLSSFFVTDTATDVIGDLDFPDLGDKAVDLVDTISTLAPFGAMLLISEVVSILSQVGKIQSPSMVFDFNFMPGEEFDLVVDVSWLDDAKPVINVVCIVTLIVALAGATARLVELEAAA